MRIAVTGHMDVSADSAPLVRSAVDVELETLATSTGYIGVTCLARGADSIFAEAVVEHGGSLEVVLPSPHYRDKKVKPDHAPTFDALLERASTVRTLPFDEVNAEAYEAANETLVSECDVLIAVWDGVSSNRSGTGSVVELARSREVPVRVIWPEGARREPRH